LLLLPAAALNPAGSAGRRCLGIAYVFRLAANNNSCALIFPNHFGSGIKHNQRLRALVAEAIFYVLNFNERTFVRIFEIEIEILFSF
jgi:uncharacterized membrane protein YvlD (DUF360 family)